MDLTLQFYQKRKENAMDPYKIWENLIDLYNKAYGTDYTVEVTKKEDES